MTIKWAPADADELARREPQKPTTKKTSTKKTSTKKG